MAGAVPIRILVRRGWDFLVLAVPSTGLHRQAPSYLNNITKKMRSNLNRLASVRHDPDLFISFTFLFVLHYFFFS